MHQYNRSMQIFTLPSELKMHVYLFGVFYYFDVTVLQNLYTGVSSPLYLHVYKIKLVYLRVIK